LFSKENQPNRFFVFLKRNRFSLFKKPHKPHSELFTLHHAISPFSKLHNNDLLYLLWHSNLRVKKCAANVTSHLCFRKSVVGHFTPNWCGLASMHTANRKKSLSHKLCGFTSSLCACAASSASIECIFQRMIYCSMV